MSIKNSLSFISLMFKRRSLKELFAKNLEILYGYPLYILSFIFPRDPNKWLIGSHIGFAGNPKYFYIYLNTEHKEKKTIWIASNRLEEEQIKRLGMPVFFRWSLKGIIHCLTAGVYIFGFHLIDVNFWTSGRVKRINLWHGVGIKNIEFKSTSGSAGKIYNEKNIFSRIYFPYLYKRPHLFLSTSPLMTEHFQACFRITGKECLEGIYPRCAIFDWEEKKLENFIINYESTESNELLEKLKLCNGSYLYMPTWRETRINFIQAAGFDFARLNSVLKEKNELFLLKLHPECNLSMEKMEQFSQIVVLNKKIDIYPLLPFTTVLITDYSSIYYDYILIPNKQVLLFPFDYSEYITSGRDLAFDFDQYTPGKRAYSFDELMKYIENNIPLHFEEREWIINQFWNYKLTINDLYEKIISMKH